MTGVSRPQAELSVWLGARQHISSSMHWPARMLFSTARPSQSGASRLRISGHSSSRCHAPAGRHRRYRRSEPPQARTVPCPAPACRPDHEPHQVGAAAIAFDIVFSDPTGCARRSPPTFYRTSDEETGTSCAHCRATISDRPEAIKAVARVCWRDRPADGQRSSMRNRCLSASGQSAAIRSPSSTASPGLLQNVRSWENAAAGAGCSLSAASVTGSSRRVPMSWRRRAKS